MREKSKKFISRVIYGDTKPSSNSVDHSGKRYGRLTAIRCVGVYVITDKTGKIKRRRVWLCRCDCGNEVETIGNRLTAKIKQSCGCLHSETTSNFNRRTKRKAVSDSSKLQQYYATKNGAAKRGYTFSLTFEEFVKISEMDCHYCGKIPDQIISIGSYSKWTKNGIDRVDNSIGYEMFNCVPCCKYCNRMKSTLGQIEFISRCQVIANRFKQGELFVSGTV